MAIFTKPPNEMPSRPETQHADATASVIGSGMRIIGDVETSGVVKIDGTIEGSVRGARQVVLGRSGVIQGDVSAQEAVLGGRVIGSVSATDRVEVQSTSRIEGDIQTKSIVVVEGGILNGHVRMEDGVARGAAVSERHPAGG